MRMQRSTMYRHKKSLDLSTTMHSDVCQFVFPVDELTRIYAKTIPSDKNTIGRQEKVLDVNSYLSVTARATIALLPHLLCMFLHRIQTVC
jgi:hypothetical protein